MDIVVLFHIVQIQQRLRRQLERAVALTDLFGFPAVCTLAQFLSGSSDNQWFECLTGERAAGSCSTGGQTAAGGALTGAAVRQHW
jgi:hypothetical protein